jgi:hypothetical protein
VQVTKISWLLAFDNNINLQGVSALAMAATQTGGDKIQCVKKEIQREES